MMTQKEIISQVQDLEAARIVGKGVRPAHDEQAFSLESLNLTLNPTTTGALQLGGVGYGVYFPPILNSPSARLILDFKGGNAILQPFCPGDIVLTPFQKCTITRHSTSLNTGVATVAVFRRPGAMWWNPSPLDSYKSGDVTVIGPNLATTQTQGAAAGTNAPSNAVDGVSLEGVESFRVLLQTQDVADAITAPVDGTTYVRFWLQYAGTWFQSDVTWVPELRLGGVGIHSITSPDYPAILGSPLAVSTSAPLRVYAEVIGWGAASNFTVRIQRYGRLLSL